MGDTNPTILKCSQDKNIMKHLAIIVCVQINNKRDLSYQSNRKCYDRNNKDFSEYLLSVTDFTFSLNISLQILP